MGKYIVSMSPIIRMDIMVKKAYHAQLVSYFERSHCTYEQEVETNPGNGELWVCLKDVKAHGGNNIGELIGLLYSIEWGSSEDDILKNKFYIILNARKKGKKVQNNVHKNRKEAGAGSEGGNHGEAAANPGPGPDPVAGGNSADAGAAGTDDLGEQPGLPDTVDGRCE